ncbi:MAG: hypothetical protein EBR82_26945 [Caulobacteraceae bacterium]|nr:hypothetical protein [Caulobacteraceae bacterium]
MTAETTAPDNANGELALAIVLEDLQARVAKAEMTEDEAKSLVAAALERFPASMHPQVHALLDRRS